ncbi:MAG: PepSY-like domain-containing protein, partial [Capnocytophaga ochracea]
MKRFLLLITAVLTFGATSAQDKKVTFNDLPADAINFVREHFLVDHIASVWKDTDYNDEEYTVIFRDGLEIEFNGDGDWKELKARHGKVPDHVVPEKIL